MKFSIPKNISIPNENLKVNNYYVVDFLLTDITNGKVQVVNPQKILNLNNLKELVEFWWEHKEASHTINNRKVKVYQMVEA